MKIKSIKRKPKTWLYPSAVEREYVKALGAITDNVIKSVDVFCKKQRESYHLIVRQDGLSDWLESVLTDLLSAMMFSVSDSEVKRLVSGLLGETNRFNQKQFHQTLKKAYGVDIFTAEPWLREQLELFELQNIKLIKSIPTQLHEKLRYKFVDAVQKGKRWEEVAKEIEELTDATRKRARLIARDQIGKLNAQLTQLRQKQIGVKSYIWRTSLDERVRKSHVGREGEQFDWDNPPNDGHPGEAINCRCYAEALLPDLDELLQSQGTIATKGENSEVLSMTSEKLVENETLPEDFRGAIDVGRRIFNKYSDLIDRAMLQKAPHEAILEIMRREGVQLSGVIDVIGVEKNAIEEITQAVKRYPKSWVEKSNRMGRVFVREAAGRAYCKHISTDNHSVLLQGYKPLKKGGLYKLAKDGDSLIMTDPRYSLSERLSTHIHEYGHRLQRALPDLDRYFIDFWKDSTKNDRIERLADVLSDPRYKGEITKKDHFPHPYYGRIYREKGVDIPKEMLTMTFEALLGGDFNAFDELLSKNPDLFDLGLALLTRYK